MSEEQIRTGLWKKEGQKGSFYSGKVTIDGQPFFVNLYKNDRKESENHPDLNLILKPAGDAQKAKAAPQRQAPSIDDLDLPF